jgi:glucose-6-phosphate 1-dehydrogenase
MGRFRKPPAVLPASALKENHMRFRVSPDVAIAIGMTVMAPGDDMTGLTAEMLASRHPSAEEMDAYKRVLGDAMEGDATLFARQDYVEEAWRIVDPVLKKATPVYQYEPKTWGPNEVQRVTPTAGWHNPTIASPQASGVARAA